MSQKANLSLQDKLVIQELKILKHLDKEMILYIKNK